MGKLALALAMTLFLLFWLAPPRTQALSCAWPDAQRSVDHSDLVVVGTPIRIDGIYGDVRVERYLKGSGADIVRIKSAMAGWGSFWSQEDIGRRWVFFLRHDGEGPDYLEWACSGSSPVGAEWMGTFYEEVLSVTGHGAMPEVTTSQKIIVTQETTAGAGESDATGYWVAGATGVGILAGLAYMRRRGWMGG